MPNPWLSVTSQLAATPPAPPDTARVYAFVIPFGTEPASVTSNATVYTTLASLTTDGWSAGDAIFDAAEDLFVNTDNPTEDAVKKLVVVKQAAPTDEVWTYLVNSVEDGVHTVNVNGVLAGSFTASVDTADDIRTGLKDAFNLGAFATSHTAADTIAATFSVTGDAPAGVPFALTGVAPAGTPPTITKTVDAVGVFADLDAAYLLEQWWGVLTPGNENSLYLDEVQRWVRSDTTSRRNMLFAQQVDTGLADSGDTDNLALTWIAAGRKRAKLWTHPTAGEYMAAALVGKVGGAFPGTRAWHYLGVSGSTETTLTPTRTDGQLSTLKARQVGYSARFYGPTSALRMYHAATPDNHFVRQIHAEDWWWFAVTVAIDAVMASNEGADIDTEGLAKMVSEVEVATMPMVNRGVLQANTMRVTHTPIADIPEGELAIGDFQTTGKITVTGTLSRALRSLAVKAEFGV